MLQIKEWSSANDISFAKSANYATIVGFIISIHNIVKFSTLLISEKFQSMSHKAKEVPIPYPGDTQTTLF